MHYRFVLWLVPTVERFPRKQKFLLGERIQATALDVPEHLIEATYSFFVWRPTCEFWTIAVTNTRREDPAKLRSIFVDVLPGFDVIKAGELWISRKYRTVNLRCPCGCGDLTVLSLHPSRWHVHFDGKSVSRTALRVGPCGRTPAAAATTSFGTTP